VTDDRWTTRVQAVLEDGEGRVLVLDGGERWRLPSVEVEGTDDELPTIREAIAETVGIDSIVVRPLERRVDEEQKVLDLALSLEPLERSAIPGSGAEWRAAVELVASPVSERDRSLLERVLSDRPPPERPQWARRGWFAEAGAWIEETVAAYGRSLTAPVEQLSNWCISSILRAETAEGRVYFKATATSPLFVDEGTVTRGLASMFPGKVPQPIAIDPARRWMLLDDFGPVVGWEAELDTRREVLSGFGELQLAAAERHDELLELGAIDRRPAWLASQIESLLRSPDPLGLEDDERDRLSALEPRFVEMCERLTAGAVPDSLVHGDLHLSNVAGSPGQYVFFDWTDACLTHPFLDLLVVLFEEDPELQRSLRDAYLGVWAGLASEEELLELWAAAAPLASLNQAISYRSIVANVEIGTSTELEPMTAVWLRKALASSEAT
jgi:Phosphotransferase enzyme family